MDTILKVDVNVVLSPELRAAAQLRAVAINPANLPPPDDPDAPPAAHELAVQHNKKWPNGYTLRIRFMDGDPVVQQRVIDFAHQWTDYANLHFDFGDYADAPIRISFDPNLGSWSYIGTDNLVIPQHQATMNFGWLQADSPDKTYSQVVLHEFGHAIGCIHEHSTPIAGVRWNKPVVYAYYAKMGWSKADVDYNVFYVFDMPSTNHTDTFDPESIMTYPILKEHTLNDFAVPWNGKLSAKDKEFIAQTYPKG